MKSVSHLLVEIEKMRSLTSLSFLNDINNDQLAHDEQYHWSELRTELFGSLFDETNDILYDSNQLQNAGNETKEDYSPLDSHVDVVERYQRYCTFNVKGLHPMAAEKLQDLINIIKHTDPYRLLKLENSSMDTTIKPQTNVVVIQEQVVNHGQTTNDVSSSALPPTPDATTISEGHLKVNAFDGNQPSTKKWKKRLTTYDNNTEMVLEAQTQHTLFLDEHLRPKNVTTADMTMRLRAKDQDWRAKQTGNDVTYMKYRIYTDSYNVSDKAHCGGVLFCGEDKTIELKSLPLDCKKIFMITRAYRPASYDDNKKSSQEWCEIDLTIELKITDNIIRWSRPYKLVSKPKGSFKKTDSTKVGKNIAEVAKVAETSCTVGSNKKRKVVNDSQNDPNKRARTEPRVDC